MTMIRPAFFARPDGPAITLRTVPRLANYNRSGESGEARLTRVLDHGQEFIDPALEAVAGPVALRFDVGLPPAVRLLDERDLDNFLLPLTAHLALSSPNPIVSVWGSKRYADETTLRIEAARPQPEPAGPGLLVLTASVVGERDDFKAGLRQQVRDRLADQPPLADGPVILELSFVVGPGRNWLDLWWSTLDGLGPLLGQSPAEPEWHPRDGRIVDLGLHGTVDPGLGDDVLIGVRARTGWLDPVPSP